MTECADVPAGGDGQSRSESQPAAEPVAAVAATVPLHGDLEQRVRQLQEALAARELQLERKSGEVSQVQAVCDQLQVRLQQPSLLQRLIHGSYAPGSLVQHHDWLAAQKLPGSVGATRCEPELPASFCVPPSCGINL